MCKTCKDNGLLCFSMTEQESLCAHSSLTHKEDFDFFVVLKWKCDMGQKATPGETSQIRETRHGNVSISVWICMHSKQPVVSPGLEGRAGSAYEHACNTCCYQGCTAERQWQSESLGTLNVRYIYKNVSIKMTIIWGNQILMSGVLAMHSTVICFPT